MPLVKLTTLAIKTLSKPLAKSLKARIANHAKLTEYCIAVGQGVHKFWSTVTIRAAGHIGLKIKPLEESAALNQGAEFVSEVFIFSVAGACVVLEMTLSDAKKAKDSEKKKQQQLEKEAALQATFESIHHRLTEIEKTHEELLKAVDKQQKQWYKLGRNGGSGVGGGGETTVNKTEEANTSSPRSGWWPLTKLRYS
jgi:optic atrophy 3 protein